MLFKSTPLHDTGKIGIPDGILFKPGRLTPEEFEIMKTHIALGRNAIAGAETQLGTEVDFLRTANEIMPNHQEKWDGSSYPQGSPATLCLSAVREIGLHSLTTAAIAKEYRVAFADHI